MLAGCSSRETVKKKRAIQHDSRDTTNNSLVETFKMILEDVENQNEYILSKLNEREKTISRLIRSSIMGITRSSTIDELEYRIFEAENQSQYILHKLRETERRIHFLTTTTQTDTSLMYDLKTSLQDIQVRNNVVCKEISYTEPKMKNLEQYSRKENIEITGIPDNVDNRDLEITIIKLLGSINVPVTSSDIVTCHRLAKQPGERSGKVIVRFVDKQISINALCNKDQLKRSIYKDIFKSNISIVKSLYSVSKNTEIDY